VAPLSLAEADLCLAEKGRIAALATQIKADCDAALAAVKETYAARLHVEIDGVAVSFAERLKALDAGLEAYADAHRAELLAGEAKSRSLNHGVIGWRKSAPSLTPAEPKGAAGGNKKLLEKIVAFVAQKLARFDLFSAGTSNFLRIKIEFDKPALLAAAQKQEIDRSELRKAGFLLDEGEDVFFAEPHSAPLASQPGN
jgi:phage host-nuclease inhibitor protein Gam